MKIRLLLFCITCLLYSLPVISQPKLEFLPYAQGFTNPVDIVNAGDDRLFVVQQGGLIRILNRGGAIAAAPFLDLTAKVSQSGNEKGLLGLAFHPRYSENGYFFVNYTRSSDGATVVSRFSVMQDDENQGAAESEKVLMVIDQPYANHNGGNILFGHDGYLYIAVGDGGSGGDPQNNAQNHSLLLGKMLRIDVDKGEPYAIPEDNPFVNQEETMDEIWAAGLRNPWRNSFDRYTGDLWIADVGQSTREEINFQPFNSIGGINYGWRCWEGTIPFNQEGCEDRQFYTFPVFEYPHQGSSCTGSVTGGYVYRGALYSSMFGYYITADFCRGEVYYVKQEDELFETGSLGVFTPFEYSTFGQDQYGELFVALRSSGNIQMLTDTSDCKPVAHIHETSPLVFISGQPITLNAFYHPRLQYQWSVDGDEIEGANEPALQVGTSGIYTLRVVNPDNNCSNTSAQFEVLPEGATSILNEKFSFTRIYPNPATGNITIDGMPSSGEKTIAISDINGRIIRTESINDSSFSIDTSAYPDGFILIRITHFNDTIVRKVLIKH